MSVKGKLKKEKSKISKLIEKSESENDEQEHELSFYINDRVKLMKEVLKIIKPKKMKTMAPDCIKDLDIEEINSMLLEELLGISNKRLKYIFNGQSLGEDSSSTDPEEEKQPIDIISLDDVSDDDFVIEVDSYNLKKKKNSKLKNEPKTKKIKREKPDKKSAKRKDGPLEEENLMSVLELLELQARARAIRSQLMLEANKKTTEQTVDIKNDGDSDTDDAVIIEIPKNEEIVINSSDSETEQKRNNVTNQEIIDLAEIAPQKKKIILIRDRVDSAKSIEIHEESAQEQRQNHVRDISESSGNNKGESDNKNSEGSDKGEEQSNGSKLKTQESEQNNDEDEIILIVDQEEMDRLIND